MEERKITYYLILDEIIGKREGYDDYIFRDNGWVPDTRMMITRRLYGIDFSEPEDSPYAAGNTDIMDELEEISEEAALRLMAGQQLRALVRKWKTEFIARKRKWDESPGWPAKLVETRFRLGGQEWSIKPLDIGLTTDGWDQGFMETIQDEMEADLRKIGAADIKSYGFVD